MKDKYDFDVIMNQISKLSEEEKEDILNQPYLDEYKDYQFSDRFEQNMKKILDDADYLKKDKTNKNKKFSNNFLKIAVAAVLVICVYSINMNVSYGNLIDIIKYCKEFFYGDMYITTQKEINSNLEQPLIEPTYIPTGYKEVSRTESIANKNICYENSEGDTIYYGYSVSDVSQTMLNTENAEIENIKIKNNDAMLIYKDNSIKLFLENKRYMCIISMEYSEYKENNYMKQEIIKIINSIIN